MMRLPTLLGLLSAAALVGGCSRSNNLLLGRVEASVAGHAVVVTDCYRTSVPQPLPEAGGMRFTPCRDADVLIRAGQLTVNGAPYGAITPGARVLVDHGRVSIQK